MSTLPEELLIAVSQEYVQDPSVSSVTMSRIAQNELGDVFYASVCRYEEAYGGKKKVVVSARASKLGTVVRLLAEKWLLSGVRHTYPELEKKLAEVVHIEHQA